MTSEIDIALITYLASSNYLTNAELLQLDQLECLRPDDTPCHLMITHTIESYWIPSQKKTKSKLQIYRINQIFLKFLNKHYTRHTISNCLIRCANMEWIRQVLLKIQSGYDSVHRRTDGQADRRTRWNQYTPLSILLKWGYNDAYMGDQVKLWWCIWNGLDSGLAC